MEEKAEGFFLTADAELERPASLRIQVESWALARYYPAFDS